MDINNEISKTNKTIKILKMCKIAFIIVLPVQFISIAIQFAYTGINTNSIISLLIFVTVFAQSFVNAHRMSNAQFELINLIKLKEEIE